MCYVCELILSFSIFLFDLLYMDALITVNFIDLEIK